MKDLHSCKASVQQVAFCVSILQSVLKMGTKAEVGHQSSCGLFYSDEALLKNILHLSLSLFHYTLQALSSYEDD